MIDRSGSVGKFTATHMHKDMFFLYAPHIYLSRLDEASTYTSTHTLRCQCLMSHCQGVCAATANEAPEKNVTTATKRSQILWLVGHLSTKDINIVRTAVHRLFIQNVYLDIHAW